MSPTQTDNDECQGEWSGHNCDANAVCTNTEGGFTCKCKDGWSGDGIGCTGIYVDSYLFYCIKNIELAKRTY